jgi:Transcriptional regulator containing PAS, AAA-type ATPase, and DNA-binding domains
MLCLVARFKDQVVRFAIPESSAKLGSSPDNDITLPFPGVSRIHARVERTSSGIRLVDVGSKNRLIMNGTRVDEVELLVGGVVQIGRAAVTIEDGPTSDVELALRIAVSNKRSTDHDTASTHIPSRLDRSPAEALKLIREIELHGPASFRKNRQLFLGRARSLVDARAFAMMQLVQNGETEVFASEGRLPDLDVLEELAASLFPPGNVPQLVSRAMHGETFVVATLPSARKLRCMVGVFAPESKLRAWERDFMQYAARKFFEDDADRPVKVEQQPVLESLNFPPNMILGESLAMQRVFSSVRATVQSRLDVLLTGETGTGKELFARTIHASGQTAAGPFVAINCAAIPSELLEAELFGVQGRVATGVDPRQGLFMQSDGGSIFLDEISELPDRLQAKLLRVVQEREVLPIGASAPKKIKVRVIAASNAELLQRVQEGTFRADLYYRLRVFEFHIPPLRERREDIPPLVLGFVERAAEEHKKRIHGVSRKALSQLMEHQWPGNVRELQNEIERAVLLCPDGGTIQSEHIGPVRWAIDHRAELHVDEHGPDVAGEPAGDAAAPPSGSTLQEQVDALERKAILDALRVCGGNKTRTARMLGVTRNGLAMKMARLKIDVDS